jgi:hypothetical protein
MIVPYSTNDLSEGKVNERRCSEYPVSQIVRSEFFLQPTPTPVTFRCLACHIPAHLERKREGPDPVSQPSIGFECAQPVTSGGLNESDQQIYVRKNGK